MSENVVVRGLRIAALLAAVSTSAVPVLSAQRGGATAPPAGPPTTASLTDPLETFDLTCAAMPAPTGVLDRAFAQAAPQLSALAAGVGYDPMGLAQLRTAIAARFTERGVATSADQILITSGALHAFDLLLRVLTGPGDRVLTELPSYPGALDAIRTNSARVVPVSLVPGAGGMSQPSRPRCARLLPAWPT